MAVRLHWRKLSWAVEVLAMNNGIKQLVILSGKGGTGKTCVTAALAHLASANNPPVSIVLADADVDAANLELLLRPRVLESQDFQGGQVARINEDDCLGCGDCAAVCRFEALKIHNGTYRVDPIACDGCAACVFQCPEEAIVMREQIVGQWFRSDSRYGPLFHAALHPAQDNSGKLVTLVKQHARLLAMDENRHLVLVDGPPGIGCPVISAASGADLALIVAEPSTAGVHDMRRVLATTGHFGVPSLVCINKTNALYFLGCTCSLRNPILPPVVCIKDCSHTSGCPSILLVNERNTVKKITSITV